ncbi:MAG: DUF6653 family protein [Pseudomonadota bacterium]
MDIFDRAERLMGMSDTVWARHASPLSCYSRFSILPLFALAVWARAWIGWGALVPVILVLIWTWANPRVFPQPRHTDNWASKGTFGERVFLNRKAVPIPAHHLRWALGLSWASSVGLPFFAWGLWAFDLWLTLLGMVLIALPKVWFVDRMVWLYEDMKEATPEYRSWLR